MGINCFPLTLDVEAKKEIMCSRTFSGTLTTLPSLKEAIASYICNASEKMRGQESLCTEISVFANTNPFKGGEQYHLYEKSKLENPTCDSRKLIKLAFSLLDKNFRDGFEYKKSRY